MSNLLEGRRWFSLRRSLSALMQPFRSLHRIAWSAPWAPER